ncbi:MAG: type II toxin-antitoxin system VapC family toxin [Thaumarchaeota archaeon]|nr:type II toxin-antitoxin system VapC family toxin [Nitrososphaerota archaeon]
MTIQMPVYLDANFFIIYNFDPTARGEAARSILERIMKGSLRAMTSALALDEVMWVIMKNMKHELLRETIEDIFAIENLVVKDVFSSTPLDALDYIEKYDLKPRDAFHVALMKSAGLNEIVSDDRDFDRVKGIKRIKL